MASPPGPGPETFVDPPPPPIRQIGRERLWNAPAAVVLGFAFALLGTIMVEIAGSAFGSKVSHPTPAVNIVADYVFDAAFVMAALYFAFIGGRPEPAEFGYRKVAVKRALIAVVLAGGGYYLLTWGYGSLFHITGKDKLPSELGVQHHTAALVGATVFVCVVAPMAEEFFFRGFFFGTLRRMDVKLNGRQLGPWIAALITAVLFGLAHTGSANSQYLVPLGFLGFVLCLVRWWTGSLYPCMALHSFNNCLALGVNQEHWTALEIIGLTVGSWALIALVTLPLARGTQPISPAIAAR
jgi:membrane protease YdiL (CAAX protease family)